MMMDTLAAIGRVDVRDPAELQSACERMLELCDACTSHLGHEDHFVHPAMEARRPGSTAQMTAEHAEHLAAIVELYGMVSGLRAAGQGAEQALAAQELYSKLALFTAENFVHMHAEEVEHNQVLWACYSDDELQALEERIVASMPPAENLTFMRWMIPAMAPVERAALLTGIQAAAPAPVWAAVLDAVQPHLSQTEWGRLINTLVPATAPVQIAAE